MRDFSVYRHFLRIFKQGEGEGLLFFGNVILPFVDRFPTDLELYRIMTTKLGEVSEGAQKCAFCLRIGCAIRKKEARP